MFIYKSGDGNDVITDYTAQDKISITGGTYTKSTVGNDVKIKVGTGSILLKNAKAKTVTINNSKAFEEHWFTEDNNFITNDLNSIIDNKTNVISNEEINLDFNGIANDNSLKNILLTNTKAQRK